MLKPLIVALLVASPLAHAETCPWMSDSKINAAYPDRAPWSTMAGGQGRCKWVSDESKPASTISLVQMIKSSPQDAEKYVKTVGGGMAKSYQVKPLTSIGTAGVEVRQDDKADSRMLTLIGHNKNMVVMTQMSFYGGVNAEQQAKAEALTKETFSLDTGGGLQMPTR